MERGTQEHNEREQPRKGGGASMKRTDRQEANSMQGDRRGGAKRKGWESGDERNSGGRPPRQKHAVHEIPPDAEGPPFERAMASKRITSSISWPTVTKRPGNLKSHRRQRRRPRATRMPVREEVGGTESAGLPSDRSRWPPTSRAGRCHRLLANSGAAAGIGFPQNRTSPELHIRTFTRNGLRSGGSPKPGKTAPARVPVRPGVKMALPYKRFSLEPLTGRNGL